MDTTDWELRWRQRRGRQERYSTGLFGLTWRPALADLDCGAFFAVGAFPPAGNTRPLRIAFAATLAKASALTLATLAADLAALATLAALQVGGEPIGERRLGGSRVRKMQTRSALTLLGEMIAARQDAHHFTVLDLDAKGNFYRVKWFDRWGLKVLRDGSPN